MYSSYLRHWCLFNSRDVTACNLFHGMTSHGWTVIWVLILLDLFAQSKSRHQIKLKHKSISVCLGVTLACQHWQCLACTGCLLKELPHFFYCLCLSKKSSACYYSREMTLVPVKCRTHRLLLYLPNSGQKVIRLGQVSGAVTQRDKPFSHG